MLTCCRDTVTRSNGFKVIRSRARLISTHLASGDALHVYSQEQRRRGGTTQQDATQSFCQNSSASFKRSLNIKFVLIYTLHNIIVCDLFHPIVACQGPLIHPVHLIWASTPAIWCSSHSFYYIQIQSRQSPGGSEESITDSSPDRRRFRTIFGSAQGLCKPRRRFCTQKGTVVRRILAHSKEI